MSVSWYCLMEYGLLEGIGPWQRRVGHGRTFGLRSHDHVGHGKIRYIRPCKNSVHSSLFNVRWMEKFTIADWLRWTGDPNTQDPLILQALPHPTNIPTPRCVCVEYISTRNSSIRPRYTRQVASTARALPPTPIISQPRGACVVHLYMLCSLAYFQW